MPSHNPRPEELVEIMAQHLFALPLEMTPAKQQERANIMRNVEQGISQAANEPRFMMYWLLQLTRKGEDQEAGKQMLLPHCRRFMDPQNSIRVRIAAASILYSAKQLTEKEQLDIVLMAETIFHGEPEILQQDTSLRSLVHWAICTFSHNKEEIQAVLYSVKGGNQNNELALSMEAINHLPTEDICTVAEHVLTLPRKGMNETDIAQFCIRVTKKLSSASSVVSQTDEDLQVRIDLITEKIAETVAAMPHLKLQNCIINLDLAFKYFNLEHFEEALKSVEKAAMLCPKGAQNKEVIDEIDLLRQNILDEMNKPEDEDESDD